MTTEPSLSATYKMMLVDTVFINHARQTRQHSGGAGGCRGQARVQGGVPRGLGPPPLEIEKQKKKKKKKKGHQSKF